MKKILTLFILLIMTCFPAFSKEKVQMDDSAVGVYVFKINTKKYGEKIKPYMASSLMTTKKLYNSGKYDLVVNGGFFDVKTGESVSYVTIDGDLKTEVKNNTRLCDDLKKQDRLEKVLSRAELRILEDKKGKLKFDINYHDEPIEDGYTLKHALQAGPMLYPSMDLVGEGFVSYENDMVKFQSVDILKRRERTAIGLKGKDLYVVIFTKDYKVDANEMRDYMRKNLKLKKILALDGGLSTSIDCKNVSIGSVGRYQRKVKSFLVIEK